MANTNGSTLCAYCRTSTWMRARRQCCLWTLAACFKAQCATSTTAHLGSHSTATRYVQFHSLKCSLLCCFSPHFFTASFLVSVYLGFLLRKIQDEMTISSAAIFLSLFWKWEDSDIVQSLRAICAYVRSVVDACRAICGPRLPQFDFFLWFSDTAVIESDTQVRQVDACGMCQGRLHCACEHQCQETLVPGHQWASLLPPWSAAAWCGVQGAFFVICFFCYFLLCFVFLELLVSVIYAVWLYRVCCIRLLWQCL